MYSNRSPPTVPAGIEFPNISMPGICGIAPSTGIKRSRKYSSMLGTVLIFVIARFLSGLGEFLEESLLGRGLAQGGVAIHTRRQPALQPFGLEYRAVNRVVVAHGGERVDEAALPLWVETGTCREHAVVVGRRGPYFTQAAFGHEAFAPNSVPEGAADGAGVGPAVEDGAHHFHFAGPGIAMFAQVA